MIASSAVNSPILKIMTNGMRITNSGIVCNVSLIGRTTADTALNCAARMPITVPMTKESATAIPHRYTDSIACGHTPDSSRNSRPPAVPSASRQPPSTHPR